MNAVIKYGTVCVLFVLSGWIGSKVYFFFFDTTQPQLVLDGLQESKYYSADVRCNVKANKSGELSIWLDNKPLVTSFKFNRITQGYDVSIPTKTLSNGKHLLKVRLADRTYHQKVTSLECPFYVDNVPLQAALVKQEGQYKVFQGRILHLQLQVNKEIDRAFVMVLSQKYECFPESKNSSIFESFIPIACEETPNEYLLTVDVVDRVGNAVTLENKFQVVVYPFKKQNLVMTAQKIAEIEKEPKEERDFEEVLEQLTMQSPREKLWRGPFCMPLDLVRVTCDFGTVRTTQEKGRYMHKAIDIIGVPKCVIWAPQDGVVVLKERFPMGGNTVIIDHGWGVLSLFCHLDSFADISVNKKVMQGNPIGIMGSTGYAKGAHLHWAMMVNNVPVDPMQWTRTSF